ncbi:threonine aldolase family protein [Frigidibacter sp. ROC022]|uniref:threonine aldolase family protein n=1 Tax=Frigidibacter sp. ROC022 TaxID=2971796 RepID=UPI00215AAC55|nr:beta-eliminating lyase-related protein [Frigidibacter sp. ROC022]MCR8725414.1 beta-eliminating lyase-related protein [Frigidibacter sp. ROC022]
MSAPMINMADDGVGLSPQEMGAALARLTAAGDVEADYYGDGGPVTELETRIAELLGKERAVMFPTGTLANMLAMRLMAPGTGARVVVHRDSHLFNDAGDNITQAGVTMVPLLSEGASFTADQVRDEIARTASARVRSRLGGICIETPNRRLANRMFDAEARGEVEALARAEGIPLFLDAARIFIESAWSGRSPAEIGAPYDFVYVSLYKYLTAPFGAVLAGPAEALDGLFHDRRRFGGGLYQMWPAALLALDALPRQDAEWLAARAAGEAVAAALGGLGIEAGRLPDDSNALRVAAGRAATTARAAREQTRASGLKLTPAVSGKVTLKINASWTRAAPDDIAARLARLLKDGA